MKSNEQQRQDSQGREKRIRDLADYYCLLYKDELEEFLGKDKKVWGIGH